MKKSILLLVLLSLPLLLEAKSSVLFLVSYDSSFPTFNLQYQGILNGFREKQQEIDLHIEFLDSKRFPYDEVKGSLYHSLTYKKEQNGSYDYVITADDNALRFVNEFYDILFPDTRIVFFGVNDTELAAKQQKFMNIGGFIEKISYEETLESILQIQPDVREVFILSDSTSSGTGDLKRIREMNRGIDSLSFHYLSLTDMSFEELYKSLSGLNVNQPVLLLSAFVDSKAEILSFHDSVAALVKHSSSPIYHLWKHGIGEGLVGGKVVDHGYYGELSAAAVIALMEGESLTELPLSESVNNRYVFDYHALKKFNFKLNRLPPDALILNEPEAISGSTLFIVFSLLFVIISLSGLILFILRLYHQKSAAELEIRSLYQALYKEREYLSITLKSIGDAVIATDDQCRITFMNSISADLTGWTAEEAAGAELEDVFHIVDEHSHRRCDSPARIVIERGEAIELANHTSLLSRRGDEFSIEDSAAPIRGKDGRILGVIIVFRDVSEKKRLRESADRNQKLEALGLLAGGIAHDFNNYLSGVFGYIELARSQSGDQEKVDDYLSKVLDVSGKAKSLTQQLLTFSRGGKPVRETVNLKETIEQTVDFVLSGSRISAELLLDDRLKNCFCDVNQIAQCIDNLVINATQSMSGGGTLTVRAENAENLPDELEGEGYVVITISDTGKGIERDILQNIFDPFFTTKETGNGLGLSTVYSIMKNHDGLVTVDSRPGKGSTFRLYIPAINSQDISEKGDEVPVFPGKGQILVLDDQVFILEILKDMLEILGYEVLIAESSDKAMAYIRNDRRSGSDPLIRACILDLTLPGDLQGAEIASEIAAIASDLPLIASSGYSENPVMANPGEYHFFDSIQKPFDLKELSAKLGKAVTSG